jgi:putative nucleotidyltransferase with HDIG domain
VIGTHIGNYRIVTELGSGAMGEVYFAEHTVMGRRAAIKVIREELSAHAETVQRFINEARMVNRIGHPNIVEITDFGQVGSRYYIMMELLEGETLEAYLEHARCLDEPEAISIAIQIADALRAAHELGVVHRDLKPENVFMVSRAGQGGRVVKVLDFGVAKLMNAPASAMMSTTPGAILGTPQYMSPEQCQGAEELDHRSDVYALGVVLYRMLTGSVPFTGDALMQILFAHMQTPPRPARELRPELSPYLEAVLHKALEKRPEDRFADMLAFRNALEGRAILPQIGANIAKPSVSANLIKPAQSSTAAKPSVSAEVVAQTPLRANAEIAAPPAIADTIKPVRAAVQLASEPSSAPAIVMDAEHEAEQSRRVGSRLARILVERIQKNTLLLPSMPRAARECLELLDDAQSGMTRVAAAIGRDPIIAPQVLRRAKSALLGGRPARVTTIEQAVARLGQRQLRALLIDLSARRLFESKNPAIRRTTHELWEHSIAVAVLARALARRRRDLDPDLAYLSGLLHDVGKPVAASLLLEVERSVAATPEAWLASGAWLGVVNECHREVGVALARSWGLPEELLVAIARSDRYGSETSMASVVCLANALAKRVGVFPGEIDTQLTDALINEGQVLFKLDDDMVESLLLELHEQGGQLATLNG